MNYEHIHTSPDIYMIDVPFENIGTENTHCYVVKDGDECLIVDTGAPSHDGYVFMSKALKELEVDCEKASLFLTHFHLDHAGLAKHFINAGTKLYVGKKEFTRTRSKQLTEDTKLVASLMWANGVEEEEIANYRFIQNDLGNYVASADNPVLLKEGDCISVGNLEFRALDTAGHTSGLMSLYEPTSGILFSGDHILFTISPSVDFFPEQENGIKTYLSNLKKVRELQVQKLLYSHGELRDDFNERIDWLIDHHEKRLGEMLALVCENPDMLGAEIIQATRWNTPSRQWSKINPIQRTIILVQGLEMLNYLVLENKLIRWSDDDGKLRYRCV